MQTNRINSTLQFGSHYLNVDIGASSILGSFKISALDDKGRLIAKNYKGTVFSEGEERNEDTFEKNVAEKITDFEHEHAKEIASADKERAAKITICYPGPKSRNDKNEELFFLSNFAYDDKKQRKFQRPINATTIESYLKQANIKIEQTRHVNDMAGAGACILSKIKHEYPEILKEGEEILFLYPGGGLGTGMIIVDRGNIKVKPTEIQHIMKYWTDKHSLEKYVGAGHLRDQFAEELELDLDDRKKIGNNTKVVTSYDEFSTVLPDSSKTQADFKNASRETLLLMMESLAQIIATKICDSRLNTVIITGNIANGIRRAVNNNDTFTKYTNAHEDDNFKATLKRRITKYMTPVGMKDILKDINRLNIIFLEIPNNTEGAQILQQGEEIGNPVAWYNIQE